MCVFFFFFQAEDGIRDYKVTGVQTCALPISLIEVARLEAHLYARWIAFDDQHRGAGHGGRQRLSAAHAAEPGAQDPFSRPVAGVMLAAGFGERDRKSTRLNSSHLVISYAVFCLKKKK